MGSPGEPFSPCGFLYRSDKSKMNSRANSLQFPKLRYGAFVEQRTLHRCI